MTDNGSNDEMYNLTPREKEVLPLISKGYSNRDIAKELGITIHTAKAHVSSIIRKFKVKKRLEAVMVAVNRKMIESESN